MARTASTTIAMTARFLLGMARSITHVRPPRLARRARRFNELRTVLGRAAGALGCLPPRRYRPRRAHRTHLRCALARGSRCCHRYASPGTPFNEAKRIQWLAPFVRDDELGRPA